MWLYLSLGSALLLGFYDVAKKKALSQNGVLYVLLAATAMSTLLLSPWLFKYGSCLADHLKLLFKGVIVTTSWISGMIGLKYLPITTASTMKATRPFLVVLFSIILFGERLNALQWGGVALAFAAMMLLNRSNRSEGVSFKSNKGLWAMCISILSGVVSALYDKHIITGYEALFVQSWGNFYITLLLVICILFGRFVLKQEHKPFKWDWTLLIITLCITLADALYFFALKDESAMLSVVSLLRRSSVLVTFIVGAIFFREKHIVRKAVNIAVLMAGMVLLVLGSK